MKKSKLEILQELQGTKPNMLDTIKNDKAFISNDIVNALFESSSIIAFKILFYIARIDTEYNSKKGRYHHLKINVKDILEYINTTKRTLNKNIQNIQKTLINYIDYATNELVSSRPLIAGMEYIDSKTLEVDIHEDILTKINMIKGDFTPIGTLNVMNIIKHKHSIRMLLLVSYINNFTTKKNKSYTLEQLNSLFGTNYKKYYEFERKILKPVKEELDRSSSLSYTYKSVEDIEYVGKGRKPIKHIIIKPAIKTYIETNIFSNFEEPQTKIKVQPKPQWKLTQELADDLLIDFGVAQSGNQQLINEFEAYLYEQEQVFIKFCIDKNKQYKNMNTSFKRHLRNAEAMQIDFFAKLRS